MTIKEIIDGLKFTVEMFLLDPITGETFTEPRNDMDKTTIDACKGAIELLEQTRWIPVSDRLPEEFQRVLVTIVNYKGDKVVRVAEYYNRKGVGVFQIKENHEQWEVGEEGLLAWTTLPEPYKTEREEEEWKRQNTRLQQ